MGARWISLVFIKWDSRGKGILLLINKLSPNIYILSYKNWVDYWVDDFFFYSFLCSLLLLGLHQLNIPVFWSLEVRCVLVSQKALGFYCLGCPGLSSQVIWPLSSQLSTSCHLDSLAWGIFLDTNTTWEILIDYFKFHCTNPSKYRTLSKPKHLKT